MITIILIIINVIIFILCQKNNDRVEKYCSSYLQVFVRKEYYRLLSSGFTHAQIWHLLCNMYSLYNIGIVIENLYGSFWYILIYLFILIGASILSLLSRHNARDDYTASIGASGAICGLIGIYFVIIFKYYGFSIAGSLIRSLLPMIIMSFMPGIDGRGHFYGFIIGGIIAFLY